MVGSSPRVWGQDANTIRSIGNTRIIPTRMGTRLRRYTITYVIRDHPHAYGDKPTVCYHRPKLQGSSPRVWGQVDMSEKLDLIHGIIPTRMGTRRSYGCTVCL